MKAAVIGYGSIGPTHRAALAADPRISSVVVCDQRADRAARAPGAWCCDHRRVLDDPAVGLITIATPHPGHADLLVAGLAAGKHVICEKPLAVHPEQLRIMIAAAAASPELVASGVFQHRFSPLAEAVQAAICTGVFGPIHHTAMDFACSRPASYFASDPWRGTWSGEGGGVLLNQAIHTLDLWLWLVGRPRSVAATVANRCTAAFSEVEDTVAATLTFAEGLRGELCAVNDLTSSWHSAITVQATRGRFTYTNNHGGRFLVLEHEDPSVVAGLRAVEAGIGVGGGGPGKECYGDLHQVQFAQVLDAIGAAAPAPISLVEAAVANEVVLACYHSAATGVAVELPLAALQRPVLLATPSSSTQEHA